MASLVMQQEGEWVRLLGATNRTFIGILQYSVKPTTHRRYDPKTRTWLVYWKQLRTVTEAAKRFYSHVDWSRLPGDWQLYLAGAEISTQIAVPEGPNPYEMLHLLDDAPLEVVKAAYKALARIYHPDNGGSEAKMAELNTAYSEICNLLEH